MKSVVTLFLAIFVLSLPAINAYAREVVPNGSKEEARAMIEKAALWFEQYGTEKTLAEITRAGTEKAGEFIDRDLYIFAYDFNGVVLAHGANPKLIGKNLFDLQDADGRYLIRGLIDTAQKGSGWYYYKWPNPITKKIEDKMAYNLKINDGLWIGCGVYGTEVQAQAEVRIGVLMLYDRPMYSEALNGIKDQLADEGFKEPAVKFTIENAKGSQVEAAKLVTKLSAARMDLIISLGTSATLAVVKEIKEIPVVFSVVYDPIEVGIARDWKSSGNNTTGTSTKIPMSKILDRLQELAPIKRLAILYTPGEKNSVAQLAELQKSEGNSGIRMIPVPLAKKEDVEQILPEVIHATDAIYLTGSSIVGQTVPVIVNLAGKEKILTVTHLGELVEKGALLGVCGDFYVEGRLAGTKVIKILNGARPASIPIETPEQYGLGLILNKQTAHAGNFDIPASFLNKVTKIVE